MARRSELFPYLEGVADGLTTGLKVGLGVGYCLGHRDGYIKGYFDGATGRAPLPAYRQPIVALLKEEAEQERLKQLVDECITPRLPKIEPVSDSELRSWDETARFVKEFMAPKDSGPLPKPEMNAADDVLSGLYPWKKR